MTETADLDETSVLGVLGGLGPGATVSFMDEIIERTPAERDQDHIEMVVYNDPKVPDRNYPERRDNKGPLPRLLRNAGRLEQAGADCIVIASNTTHRYYDPIADAVDVPMPHMIQLVRARMEATDVRRAGVLTTTTAVEIELFDGVFSSSEVELVYPDDMERSMESIYAYKEGNVSKAKRRMDAIVGDLVDQGVDIVLLGCTEFSALTWDHDVEVIDSASVLADHCVKLFGSEVGH